MENKEQAIKEAFQKDLKAVNYVAELASFIEGDDNCIRIPLKFFYEILQSGRFQGSKLLEIGSGAVVHNIASAVALFPNVIMSDFVEDNCEELKRWLSGRSNLKQFLNVPAEIEGYITNVENGQKVLEHGIRSSVKQVVRCDVLSDQVLIGDVKPEVAPPYDLIISSYCLECATPDMESLVQALKRIHKLLRPGGGLILAGFFGGKPWQTAEKTTYFHYLDITEQDLRKALKESGFGNVDLRKYGHLNITYNHDELYCLAAEKL